MNIVPLPLKEITEAHLQLTLCADPSRKLINSYLKRACCFQLLEAKQLVGIVALLPTRPETIEIVNLAVLGSYQNQGYGQRLLNFVLDFARQQNYLSVEIGTGSTSFQQLALYQKYGFRMTSIDQDYFVRHYETPIFENQLELKDMVRLQLIL